MLMLRKSLCSINLKRFFNATSYEYLRISRQITNERLHNQRLIKSLIDLNVHFSETWTLRVSPYRHDLIAKSVTSFVYVLPLSSVVVESITSLFMTYVFFYIKRLRQEFSVCFTYLLYNDRWLDWPYACFSSPLRRVNFLPPRVAIRQFI